MSNPAVVETSDHWLEAVDLAGLHACRSVADLDQELACKLVRLFPGADAGLCLRDEDGGLRAEVVIGAGCPWQQGEAVDPAAWPAPRLQRLPLRFRNHDLGELLLAAQPSEAQAQQLAALLAHYGVAIVNLTLNEESRRATDHYCANLQALEEGIVLFQECDREAVLARLIGLATTMLQASAGALYVLSEVGNADSELQLAQALGIPEPLLHDICGQDGSWPRAFLHEPPRHFDRQQDASLGGLDPDRLPPILRNLVTLPLCYHGVVAGIVVVFNVYADRAALPAQLERVDSLGQLGAALLHRFALEAQTALTRSLARELQIAETIQQRLLPRQAPAVPGYQFAWRSVAARQIGGDYLDLLAADDGAVHALIADASGHGIDSALLMSSLRASWRGEAPWQQPSALLAALNAGICDEVGSTGMFITAATVRLQPAAGELQVTSAGHNPLLLYRAGNGQIEAVDAHGPPLGFLPDAGYAQQQLRLQRGDVLLLYTDGVTEACSAEQEMFGDDRLQQCLLANAGRSADEVLAAVLAEVSDWTGRSSLADDMSLSVIKRC